MPSLSRHTAPLLVKVGGKPRDQYDRSKRKDSESSTGHSPASLQSSRPLKESRKQARVSRPPSSPKKTPFKPVSDVSDSSGNEGEDAKGRSASSTSMGKKSESSNGLKQRSGPLANDDSPKKMTFRPIPEPCPSDSDSESPERGGIKPTLFKARHGDTVAAKKSSSGTETPADAASRPLSTRNGSGAKRSRLNNGDELGGEQKRKASATTSIDDAKQASKAPSSSVAHMLDAHGFTKKRKSATYGSKNVAKITKTYGSEPKVSQFQAKFGRQGSQEGKAVRKPSASGFKALPDDDDDGSQGENPGFKSIPASDASAGKKSKKRKLKTPVYAPEDSETESQARVFRMPDDDKHLTIPTADGPRAGSPLSDVESERETTKENLDDFINTSLSSKPTCPWCGEAVDKQFFEDYSKGKRLNVRQQTRFCRAHNQSTAQQTWSSRGYPTIHWDELPDRITLHYDFLLEIINDERPSHHRAELAEKIEAGADRAMKKEENLNPGYYGPRGFVLMCDRLVERFGELLKPKAVHDRVISGRGTAAFIQAVLVAELAVQLIKEDMDVDEDEARRIMEESKALGEMVHEEV